MEAVSPTEYFQVNLKNLNQATILILFTLASGTLGNMGNDGKPYVSNTSGLATVYIGSLMYGPLPQAGDLRI